MMPSTAAEGEASGRRKNVAVLFGGRSVEHEISVITALQLINVLDVVRYRPVPVYIAQSGRWYSGDALLRRDFYRRLPEALSAVHEVTLLPRPGTGGLTVLAPASVGGLRRPEIREGGIIPVDIYVVAFHGTYGEDGCIQGLLELADVTYTGSSVLASAVGMNKHYCKTLVAAGGIPVLPGTLVDKAELRRGLSALRARIRSTPGLEQYPLFVKPCTLGSSIGVSRAADDLSLDAALVNTFRYDTQALVEPYVQHLLEVNVAVLGADELVASVVEIPVATAGVLTYEDKYLRADGSKADGGASGMAGLTRIIDPADLPTEIKDAVVRHALGAFTILGCAGVARFDFIVDTATDRVYFNEVNTLPGSLAYYLWAKSHPPMVYTALLNCMIEQAEQRRRESVALQRDEGFRSLAR